MSSFASARLLGCRYNAATSNRHCPFGVFYPYGDNCAGLARESPSSFFAEAGGRGPIPNTTPVMQAGRLGWYVFDAV